MTAVAPLRAIAAALILAATLGAAWTWDTIAGWRR